MPQTPPLPHVALPAYDRAKLTAGIVHIGVGNFHRAHQAVYLDDLGTNLKPARTMGMRTIKVGDPASAIAELESVLEIRLT